ncbi:MAG: acyl-CoA dehydrogenase [Filomicrobium sp.]
MATLAYLAVLIALVTALAMKRATLIIWAGAFAAVVLATQLGFFGGASQYPPTTLLGILAWTIPLAFAVLAIPSVRRTVVIEPAFNLVRNILPRVSETEQQALDAGTVGFDAQLFSGTPKWDRLHDLPRVTLTDEERAFLEGPTEDLCRMVDDWQIRFKEKEIPQDIWDFVADKGFLGMLISKEHGGLGFSAQAQSLILGKISSRSPDVATIVMVPNSLGPGELIEKYGTDEQKSHYLPRLAQGQEIPCFSLTGPTSGSDAATMRDIGRVERAMHDGQETLGIRLNWEKRYITLGPKATLVGLAFRLFDPDNLLGKGEDVGITLALIPADHPGVEIGRRHLPSGSAFPNGPNWGKDVFIPLDWVIGGSDRVGHGWRMLMECLAAGRAISLPSSATAGAKAMLRHTSAYARIRKQFGIPIARMDGVAAPLARIAENAYVNEAARGVTATSVSEGEKPSVISALMKYQTTERMRQAVNDAMDIHGGRAICDGPSNYLQAAYQMVPVAITVEGANILTRSLITFTQGALRAHPYLYREIQAAQNPDKKAGLADFEDAFAGHISFSVSNVAGALFHNLTFGAFGKTPLESGPLARHYRQLWRQSRNFALVADTAVATLGGGMKTRQMLTGRMADALSELYLLACVLKRFEDDGNHKSDLPIVELAMRNGLCRFQNALNGAIENFPNPIVRKLLGGLVFPFGIPYRPASDALTRKVARAVSEPGDVRDRLTRDIFISTDPADPTGLLEATLARVVATEAAEKKLDKAIRQGTIRRYHGIDWFDDAAKAGVITPKEAEDLKEAESLVARTIAVDHFSPEEVKPNYQADPAEAKQDLSAEAAE